MRGGAGFAFSTSFCLGAFFVVIGFNPEAIRSSLAFLMDAITQGLHLH